MCRLGEECGCGFVCMCVSVCVGRGVCMWVFEGGGQEGYGHSCNNLYYGFGFLVWWLFLVFVFFWCFLKSSLSVVFYQLKCF